MLTRSPLLRRGPLFLGLVALASAALLGVGLFGMLAALTDDNLDLPSAGSIEQLIEDARPPPTTSSEGVPLQLPPAEEPPGPLPVRLVIDRLAVDAPVVALGLDSQAQPQVPDEAHEVAWYDFSARPGQGSNAVLSGHVDWRYGRTPVKGVFYDLKAMQVGDIVRVYLEDGQELRYRVTANVAINYADPNVLKVMGDTAKDVLTLITCGGFWFLDRSAPYGGNYSHRVIVRAEREDPGPVAGKP